METNLVNKWNLWYHSEKDNWNISGYKKIYTIENVNEFWQLYNNWNKLGGLTYKHFFLMKNDITPIWEDPKNIKGGCWSYKININQVNELWEDLSIYLVTENLSNENNLITGLSVCLKKNNNCVIKIWNNDSKKTSLSLLNHFILEKWSTNIIYIAHMTDNSIVI